MKALPDRLGEHLVVEDEVIGVDVKRQAEQELTRERTVARVKL